MSADDALDPFQCPSVFKVSIFSANGGNLYLAATRLFQFVLLYGFTWFSKTQLSKKVENEFMVVRGLILPFYFKYIQLYLAVCIITCTLDVIVDYCFPDNAIARAIVYSLEAGIYHCLYEGLAFFLIRLGAGVKALNRSLRYGLLWGFFSAVVFSMIFLLYNRVIQASSTDTRENWVYGLYMAYNLMLFIFYFSFLVVPNKYLFRRPAMVFYARFNAVYAVVLIIIATLLKVGVTQAYCYGAVCIFFLTSLFQPIVIFKSLQLDSQYWQGVHEPTRLGSFAMSFFRRNTDIEASPNPLFQVLDSLSLDTAHTVATQLHTYTTKKKAVDSDMDFISGGFSKVFFGTVKNKYVVEKTTYVQYFQRVGKAVVSMFVRNPDSAAVSHTAGSNTRKVALKVLSVMELTPEDIENFYSEATVLAALQHENIVRCEGISVMPPMLILVLELCRFGSLFDFIHKAPTEVDLQYVKRLVSDGLDQGVDETKLSLYSQETDLKDFETADVTKRNSERESIFVDSQKGSWSSAMGRLSSFIPRFSTNSKSSMEDNTRHSSLAALLPLDKRLRLVSDAISAIHFLHSNGYMHCDIKSLNFLVAEDLKVKLADMGEAKKIDSEHKRDLPPIPCRNWAPPEVFKEGVKADDFTVKSDIYGLAVVLSEILSLELPFGDLPDRVHKEQWFKILAEDNTRPNLPPALDTHVRNLICRMWDTDPNLRPYSEEIFQTISEHVI